MMLIKRMPVKSVLLIAAIFMLSSTFASAGGWDEKDVSGPSIGFEKAYKAFEQGKEKEAKGDRFLRSKPGTSMHKYKQAEDYYAKAAFFYREISVAQGVDVAEKIAEAEAALRAVHVKFGKARKKSGR